MSDFAEAVARIERAKRFADLIGAQGVSAVIDAGPGVAVGGAERAYRMLVKIVHPDVAPAGQSATATQAFAKLAALWADRDVLTTRRGSYRLGALVAAGDIADLYAIEDSDALLKLPRQPADNDLMAAEADALRKLGSDPKFRAYIPRLIDSFGHEDERGARRTANVIARQRDFVSLAGVAAAHPGGVDPRDAAWMWRRLLTALGWAHRSGVVHGAILPEHVLVHPAEHGLVLVDWCYAVAPGERIAAIVAGHRHDYPSEVVGRRPAGPATDIFMATGLIRRLIKDPPAPMARFADGCLYDALRMRPQDAWKLLAEFDELLEALYGPMAATL
jgi:serine/threonine protein kinase